MSCRTHTTHQGLSAGAEGTGGRRRAEGRCERTRSSIAAGRSEGRGRTAQRALCPGPHSPLARPRRPCCQTPRPRRTPHPVVGGSARPPCQSRPPQRGRRPLSGPSASGTRTGDEVRSKGAKVAEADGGSTHGVLAVAPREDQLVRAVAEHRRGTVDDAAEGHVPEQRAVRDVHSPELAVVAAEEGAAVGGGRGVVERALAAAVAALGDVRPAESPDGTAAAGVERVQVPISVAHQHQPVCVGRGGVGGAGPNGWRAAAADGPDGAAGGGVHRVDLVAEAVAGGVLILPALRPGPRGWLALGGATRGARAGAGGKGAPPRRRAGRRR